MGKRQDCNALLMWSSSLDKSVSLLKTTLALCAKVLYTLCLAVMQLLSQ